MNITADTNVLVRAVVQDNAAQASIAVQLLTEAELIAVTSPTLCEFVWVLRRLYGFTPLDIANAIRALVDAANVVTNRPAVDAGLAMLAAGGDFADGVIAHEGRWLGGETFASFDKKAVSLLGKIGETAQLLAV
jgi:predicted nucleic-acid-binding protein